MVVLRCCAVCFPHPSSNDIACVVVRSRSSSGQQLLDPRLCVCQVSKLIHLRLVREILGTVDDSSIVLALSLVSRVSKNPRASSLHLWELLLGCQVALVLDEKLVDFVGDMLVDLTHPSLHVAERLLVRDILDCGDVVCSVSVDHVRQELELTNAVSH